MKSYGFVYSIDGNKHDVILANEEALRESFIPMHFFHRENVVKEIA